MNRDGRTWSGDENNAILGKAARGDRFHSYLERVGRNEERFDRMMFSDCECTNQLSEDATRGEFNVPRESWNASSSDPYEGFAHDTMLPSRKAPQVAQAKSTSFPEKIASTSSVPRPYPLYNARAMPSDLSSDCCAVRVLPVKLSTSQTASFRCSHARRFTGFGLS